MSILLLIHELGHFLTAGLLGCSLDKIYFYPFGGISKFQIDLNKPILEEFFILIMGPLFQMLAYGCLKMFPFTPLHQDILKEIHVGLLLFNLLPIYPLDGGRIFLLLLESFCSFVRSFKIIFIWTFLCIFFIFFLFLRTHNYSYLFIFLLLFVTFFKENERFPYYYEKFLLERFLKKYRFKKGKIVQSIQEFQRNRSHLIYRRGKYYTESEILFEKFSKNG